MKNEIKNYGKIGITVNGYHNSVIEYKKLCIVTDAKHNGYISIKDVPANIQLSNAEYWLPFTINTSSPGNKYPYICLINNEDNPYIQFNNVIGLTAFNELLELEDNKIPSIVVEGGALILSYAKIDKLQCSKPDPVEGFMPSWGDDGDIIIVKQGRLVYSSELNNLKETVENLKARVKQLEEG